MTAWVLYALSGMTLFVIGLVAVFAAPHPVRRILAANIMGSGVFLVLVALARRSPGSTPDPVPHALVLTGIVVSVSATALGIALARRTVGVVDEEAAAPDAEPQEPEPPAPEPQERSS